MTRLSEGYRLTAGGQLVADPLGAYCACGSNLAAGEECTCEDRTNSPSAARVRRCAICGKGPCRLRMPYRAVYPHAPICDACAGPNRVMAQDAGDAWAEFHPYPIDAQVPLRPESRS